MLCLSSDNFYSSKMHDETPSVPNGYLPNKTNNKILEFVFLWKNAACKKKVDLQVHNIHNISYK